MRISYYLLLTLTVFFSLSQAQPIERHGPYEVYYAVDLIEGKNGRLFLSTSGGIYFSDDLGDQWQRLEASMNSAYIEPRFSINNRNGDLYAWDRQHGVYSTDDNGETWKSEFLLFPPGDSEIQALAIDGDTLFLGTKKGLKIFYGDGLVRNREDVVDLQNKEVTALHVEGNSILVGTKTDGIFLSDNRGKTWENRSTELPVGFNVKGIVVSKQIIYVYSDLMGVYYSSNKGLNWTMKNVGFSVPQVNRLFIDSDLLYAVTNSYYNVYRSDLDDGEWILIDNGIPNGVSPRTLYASGDNLIVGGWHGVYKSTNGGDSFMPSYKGITDAFVFINMEVSFDGTIYAIGSHTGIYKMSTHETLFTPFVRINGGVNYGSSSIAENVLPVVQDYIVRMYDLTEEEWKEELIYLNVLFADKLIKTDGQIFISSKIGGIFRFAGTHVWEQFNDGLGSLEVVEFILLKDRFLVGTKDGLFSRSVNESQWNRISFSSSNIGVRRLFAESNLMLVTANDYNTYLSDDNGEHWRIVEELKSKDVTAYASLGNILYAASHAKLYFSSDNGQNWAHRDLPGVSINSLAIAREKLFLGTLGHGVWSTSLKIDQQIIFRNIPPSLSVGSPYALEATSSSGLPINFMLVSGPASLYDSILTADGEGDILIRAIQSGNDIYNTIEQEQVFHAQIITSIEYKPISALSVFPNPASNFITVFSNDMNSAGNIRLIDSTGRVIRAEITFNGQIEIPIVDIPNGMYFLQYSIGKNIGVKKVVIKQ
jgi:photosystem II stability/assembly factor-like uncharacterized protein